MGSICERLLPECVLLDPQERGKESIVRRLVDMLAQVHDISDTEQLVNDIMKREELGSTCIGSGCAVPHAHSSTLDTTIVAAARLSPPQDFAAPDGEPVSLVFLMAGPDTSASLHIRLLSKLARLLYDNAFRGELREVETAEGFRQLMCRKEE